MTESIILGEIDISALLKAQLTFQEALKEADSPLTRDGTIQRFEYTFELAWKTLKRVLKYNGVTVNSPRDTIRAAAKETYIDSPEEWFAFLEYRNNTVHTYNQDVAEEIFSHLPEFEGLVATLIKRISKL